MGDVQPPDDKNPRALGLKPLAWLVVIRGTVAFCFVAALIFFFLGAHIHRIAAPSIAFCAFATLPHGQKWMIVESRKCRSSSRCAAHSETRRFAISRYLFTAKLGTPQSIMVPRAARLRTGTLRLVEHGLFLGASGRGGAGYSRESAYAKNGAPSPWGDLMPSCQRSNCTNSCIAGGTAGRGLSLLQASTLVLEKKLLM